MSLESRIAALEAEMPTPVDVEREANMVWLRTVPPTALDALEAYLWAVNTNGEAISQAALTERELVLITYAEMRGNDLQLDDEELAVIVEKMEKLK